MSDQFRRESKLDFWIKERMNVLFIGKHGTGKTSIVKEAFERANLKWKYFSAATMDPWVDFVGVPTKQVENDKTYLQLIRPKEIMEAEAIFFDEFNRAHKKVRNACMELLQFKSINGERLPNLKIIWAAINPDDGVEEYDVEKIDPAQLDRFHIKLHVDYKPNADWFRQNFPDTADAALEWWHSLPDEQKNIISPRRLEYALKMHACGGGAAGIRDIVGRDCNASKLAETLKSGPIADQLANFMRNKDREGAKHFLARRDNLPSSMRFIIDSPTLMEFFLPLVKSEGLSGFMADTDSVAEYVIQNSDKVPHFTKVCDQILTANQNQKLVTKIRRRFQENQNLAITFSKNRKKGNEAPPHFCSNPEKNDYSQVLMEVKGLPVNNSTKRAIAYNQICKHIPENLTPDQALETLCCLNLIFGQHQISEELLQFHYLPGIINHAIDKYCSATGKTVLQFFQAHGHHFGDLMRNIEKLPGVASKIKGEN